MVFEKNRERDLIRHLLTLNITSVCGFLTTETEMNMKEVSLIKNRTISVRISVTNSEGYLPTNYIRKELRHEGRLRTEVIENSINIHRRL